MPPCPVYGAGVQNQGSTQARQASPSDYMHLSLHISLPNDAQQHMTVILLVHHRGRIIGSIIIGRDFSYTLSLPLFNKCSNYLHIKSYIIHSP